jgi:hypothetical protein
LPSFYLHDIKMIAYLRDGYNMWTFHKGNDVGSKTERIGKGQNRQQKERTIAGREGEGKMDRRKIPDGETGEERSPGAG